MRTVALPVAFCLSLLASPAAAQAPFPGGVQINGAWVPCDHPIAIVAGLGCGTTPTPAPTPPPTPTAACDPWPNPYTEQTRLMACLASRPAPTPNPQVVTFTAGDRYADGGYPSLLAIVLTTGVGVDGRPFVVMQRLTDTANGPAGQVFVIRPDEHHVWIRYQGSAQ